MRMKSAPETAPRYGLHPDVVWIERPDGSAHLMHMSFNVCAIDSAASMLLKDIVGAGAETAAARLAGQEGITIEDARADVIDFIASLRSQKLIQKVQPNAAEAAGSPSFARTLTAGLKRAFALLLRSPQGQVRGMMWTARLVIALFGWARAVRSWESVYPQPTTAVAAESEVLASI